MNELTRTAQPPYPQRVTPCCDDAPYCDFCGEDRVTWRFEYVGTCDDCKDKGNPEDDPSRN